MLVVDEEARAVEVVLKVGRVRKRDVVVARAGFDEAKPRVAGDELSIAGVSLRLGAPDRAAVMDALVGPKRAKVMQGVGEAAKDFVEARAKAMEFSAELMQRPREALFRAMEAAAGGSRESIDSAQSRLAGETRRCFESLRALLVDERSGLTQSGANRVWAAVYAVCLIQDSVRSKDEGEAAGALEFLGKLSQDGKPAAPELMALGLQEATARLTQGTLTRIALGDKDWAD